MLQLKKIYEMTDGLGVDVAIGSGWHSWKPLIFAKKLLQKAVMWQNVGVHGKSVELHLEDLWIKNITIATGLVSTNTTPMLLKTVSSGKIKPQQLVTHHFKFSEIMDAYDTFGKMRQEKMH